MFEYYQKIKEANAVVIDSPVYFDAINGIEINPKDAGAYYNRGNTYAKSNHYDQGILSKATL